MSYCFAQTSLAHTHGNMTAFITEFIKGLFPKGYFSNVFVSTEISYRQFMNNKNSNREFFKKSKPVLIIKPRIDIGDNDLFLNGTYLTTRITDNYMEPDLSNLQSFFYDEKRGLALKYLLNRIKISFDITIVTDTQIDQINQAYFLKNRIREDRPFFLNTSLESYIPKDLINIISKDVDIPLKDENGSIKSFVDYMNSHSAYPTTYKMKNSTGNNEFFRFYPAQVDTVITGLNIDDGSKKGMVFDEFNLSFTVTTEFYSAGLYYYFSPSVEAIDGYIFDMVADKEIVPIFTVSNLYDSIGDNWEIYISTMYNLDNNGTDEELELSSIFDNGMINILNKHIENDMDINRFMRVIVMKDNSMLNPTEYEMDFSTLVLTTLNGDIDATYRLIIHVDKLYINEYTKNINNLNHNK